jgi:phospholipid/cholesterol/gamma-HCH transport system permease protein
MDYSDGSGIGLLLELHLRQQSVSNELRIQGVKAEFQRLLDLFDPDEFPDALGAKSKRAHFIDEIGRATVNVWEDTRTLIAFVGELGVALVLAIFHPRQVRWRNALLVAETAGVNALPFAV